MKLGWITLLCLSLPFTLNAQLLKDLQKAAVDTGKKLNTKENRDKVATIVIKDMEKARAEFDSTDFDYAILVSDNSGLFDLKEKGESAARFTSVVGLGSSYLKNDELSDAEKARFHREMGEVWYANGKFKMAEAKFTAAKGAYEKAGLREDIGYIKTLSDQGLLYNTMGRFTQAEGATAEALDMRVARFGADNLSVAASKNNYGVLKYNLARYNEAEKDLEAAEAVINANNLQAAMQHAIVLNNQAMLFQTIGRLEEAEKKLKEAVAIAEKIQGTRSKNNLRFLANLALLYQQMGKYTEAETIYTGMEKRLGKNNPDYAAMLNNQAALYMVMGKEDNVEDLLKRSAAIYRSKLTEESPAYARAVSDQGNFYRYRGRYSEAGPLLEKALSVRETTLGKSHPLYVQSQEDLAILYWKQKVWDKAFTMYREAMDKSLDFVSKYFPPMSEAEKTKYWDVLSPRFQRFYNFAVEASPENPQVVAALFDYRIATKALLLNSTNKVKQTIFASKDPVLIGDYVTWLDQKETLARLYAYSKDELKLQKINLDSLERAANAMERSLSQRSADFSSGYTAQKITFGQLAGQLTDAEAVVEIVRVQKFDQKFAADARYLALILTRGAASPTLVVLENGQQLDTRYAKFYRNAIQTHNADDYSYDQFWARIEPALTGKKLLYVSLDGAYNQLNLNTLKKPGGDYVVNRYDVVVLGNSKDLIALKARKPRANKKNATLLGFPDYGAGDIAPLPGTKVEIDNVNKVLKASAYQVTQYMQKTATEKNLKAVKAPTLLHVATHGYFLQDVEQTGNAFGVQLENAGNNPLLRSGLLLAGASGTASGTRMPDLESNDNGVLTAYEAMNLNLDGTGLVVLSACETGLGDVKAGEGVYGLQRAFLVAGAEALIMSLWKVDDAATQMLMSNFYTQWIKLGNKQKAFKQAQLQLMTKYKDPYYWGAFVMMGM
ncbi:CHAT domain-containing tetratricopeptide repeat protein [Dawidia soli]|uniref:CHAT domain-containing protein n=1 Tax=Dawidia soli TaxID=2782352 RepID=A0AAP2D8K7_9BACT|nr:CHAT domain-containing tetratricopeptide repeat protein [Dawidia soli]MBT1687493.1 CHAT domain-containing protein [Dawidia soli]